MPGVILIHPIVAATISPRIFALPLTLPVLKCALKLVTRLLLLLFLLFGRCRIAQDALYFTVVRPGDMVLVLQHQ